VGCWPAELSCMQQPAAGILLRHARIRPTLDRIYLPHAWSWLWPSVLTCGSGALAADRLRSQVVFAGLCVLVSGLRATGCRPVRLHERSGAAEATMADAAAGLECPGLAASRVAASRTCPRRRCWRGALDPAPPAQGKGRRP
jgi:hypothetical protein